MKTDPEDALRELVDRAQIGDLLLRYARGVDRRDLDLVRACFTPGARYEGSLSSSDIDDALRNLRTSLERYAATMHFFANQTIEITGDEARSETYAVAYHRQKPGAEDADLVLGVRYLDTLVRDRGKWLIRHRRAICDWRRRDGFGPGAVSTRHE